MTVVPAVFALCCAIAVIHCLQHKHKDSLNPECAQEVFRQQLEADQDIRLNVPLFQKCLADKKHFCADVAPGHAAVRDCLVDHRNEPGFSSSCR